MPGESDLRQTARLSDLAPLAGGLRDVAVRDLLWLLNSPSLLHAGAGRIPQAHPAAAPLHWPGIAAWLAALDAQPARLHAALAASPQKRLGHYAEQLLAFFLGAGIAGRLIAANLPLRRAGQTLGECDFLLEALDGTRLHWELAVKCYLYVDPPPGTGEPAAAADDYALLARYVGPNLADRFDLKLSRMVQHQLPLSARPEFAALAGGPWQAELLLRGWLFYPLAPRRWAACRVPDLLEPQHLRGWWASVDEWRRWHAGLGAEAWLVLPRLEWMAPRRLAMAQEESARLLDSDALDARLNAHFGAPVDSIAHAAVAATDGPAIPAAGKPAGPWLIAGLARAGDAWVEVSRGFVVDADWCARARVYAGYR